MIDQLINQAIVNLRTPFLNKLMLLVTLTGNWQMIVWGSVLTSILLFISQKKHYLVALLSTNISALFFVVLVKNLIARTRPPVENALIIEHGFSLPSGHSYFAVVFYGLLTYFLFRHFRQKWLKISLFVLGLIYILFLAFSRLYLGVHWFTDVIAGLSLGLVWLSIMVLYIEYKNNSSQVRKPLVNQKTIKSLSNIFIFFWLIELFWLYQNNINTLGAKIINPISPATIDTTNTAPAAKSRANVVSEY